MRKNKWLNAVLAGAVLSASPSKSHAGVFVNITIAPPAIPVYAQPIAPGPDYIWTPGYWQWDANVGDYFWVPGTWIAAPQPGYLWTPGYWAFDGGYYGWHAGYWGPHIGFYGGVNYGFGYFGHGFEGGYWNGGHFFYNTACAHVNVIDVHNTYVHNVTVVNNVHTSFVGGSGLQSRPTPGEQAAFRENHVQPTGTQMQNAGFARRDRSQFAAQNHGAPPAAALARPATSTNALRQGNFAGRPAGNQPGMQQRGFQGAQPNGQFADRPQGNANPGVANRAGFGGAPAGQNQPVQQRPQNLQEMVQQRPQQRVQDFQRSQPQRQQPELREQPRGADRPTRGGGGHEERPR